MFADLFIEAEPGVSTCLSDYSNNFLIPKPKHRPAAENHRRILSHSNSKRVAPESNPNLFCGRLQSIFQIKTCISSSRTSTRSPISERESNAQSLFTIIFWANQRELLLLEFSYPRLPCDFHQANLPFPKTPAKTSKTRAFAQDDSIIRPNFAKQIAAW